MSDPMTIPKESLQGKSVRLYVSKDDSASRSVGNAEAFKQRFESAADITIVPCSGGHSDASCVQGGDIVKWFTQLG